jgi:hypothetical protein
MPDNNAIKSTSQQYLDIYDITNDLVILKSGAASIILTVTAMNFGLLAEEEQDAIIYGYAGLLNSLNYSIEILIRSQTKDVTSYLNLLKEKEEAAMNRNKKEQIHRYREFVANLVQERNVLDKKFYVVIPASALELGLVSTQSVIPGVKTPDISTYDRSVIIERARNLLEPKRDHLIAQFSRIGLFSRLLKTQEIIQLFYSIYNPEATDGQKMTDSQNYTTATVQGNYGEEIFATTRSHRPTNMTRPTSYPVNNWSSALGAASATSSQPQQVQPTETTLAPNFNQAQAAAESAQSQVAADASTEIPTEVPAQSLDFQQASSLQPTLQPTPEMAPDLQPPAEIV